MIVIYQKFIYRADMQANSECLYLWGDNEARKGVGGQAKEMRDEPNGIGIRTKKAPLYDESAYWSDKFFERQVGLIDEDFYIIDRELPKYKALVIPLDGIGTGMAQLTKRAPKTLQYLNDKLMDLIDRIEFLFDEKDER